MSREDEIAARGLLLTDYLEVQALVAELEHKAESEAASLHALARAVGAGAELPEAPDAAWLLDAERLRGLVAELRAARERKGRLAARLKALGLAVSG